MFSAQQQADALRFGLQRARVSPVAPLPGRARRLAAAGLPSAAPQLAPGGAPAAQPRIVRAGRPCHAGHGHVAPAFRVAPAVAQRAPVERRFVVEWPERGPWPAAVPAARRRLVLVALPWRLARAFCVLRAPVLPAHGMSQRMAQRHAWVFRMSRKSPANAEPFARRAFRALRPAWHRGPSGADGWSARLPVSAPRP